MQPIVGSRTRSHTLRQALIPAVCLVASACAATAVLAGGNDRNKKPQTISIADQGAFAFGGTIASSEAGTLHCDHGYAQYNVPTKASDTPLVMWHSASSITWEHTPDGRDAFQQIFLRKNYPVYIIDLPRQGKAGWACVPMQYEPEIGRDQGSFESWRFGTWAPDGKPNFFPGIQVPTRDPEYLNQLLRARYPEFDDPDTDQFEADSVAALLKKIGPSVLVTHSGSGVRGWVTGVTTPKVKGIVAFEPSMFLFPPGEVPTPIASAANGQIIPVGRQISESDFRKLTKFPIQIFVGDYVPDKPEKTLAGPERRRIIVLYMKSFIKSLQKRGGHVELIELPKRGIKGNTHMMMLDLNNAKIAELMADFLKRQRLGGR